MGMGSRMDLHRTLLLCFSAAFLAYGTWLLPVLTDWVSSAVDEGYTSHAARRIREGEWPHRDFFFLWTPGTAYLHALLQTLGASWLVERAASLVAACGTCVLLLSWARKWRFSRADRIALASLFFLWSFTLWNIPYSSWYSIFAALLAMRALPRRLWLAGILFGLSFWFKQNIGILSLLGVSAWLFFEERERRPAALLPLVTGFALTLFIPFTGMLIWGGSPALIQAVRQIFLFPLSYPSLMGTAPPARIFAAPLTSLGLWIISLFFLRSRSSQRSTLLLQMGMLAYVSVHALRAPREFITGWFMLLSMFAWPFSFAVEFSRGSKEGMRRFLLLWLPGLGIFLQVFPRLDFQHFLFVFPLSAFFLVHGLSALRERYSYLAGGWLRLPLLLIAAGGIFLQSQVWQIRVHGQEDPLGRISRGEGYRLNEEVAAVRRFLLHAGLKPGEPILVLPNATAVYLWAGFRNITPHQQFFPGYVEAFGQQQAGVLASYRERGGRYLVVQERSGLETNAPEIFREIERSYEAVKMFPEHFTIYLPRDI